MKVLQPPLLAFSIGIFPWRWGWGEGSRVSGVLPESEYCGQPTTSAVRAYLEKTTELAHVANKRAQKDVLSLVKVEGQGDLGARKLG